MISKNQMKLVRQLEQKKYRQREGLFVAEGPKVVGDLLRHGFRPHLLFATDEWQMPHPTSKGDELQPVAVSSDELRRLSFLQHPQQVLGVFPVPQPVGDTLANMGEERLLLALDGVQDPGNLGTIIRIADWFGIDTLLCSHDTADAWSPKVVQATMGSIARVHLIYCDLAAVLSTTQLPVYGTLLDGHDLYQEPLTAGGIIVMGNEGNGISQPVRQLIKKRLLIPSYHEGDDAAESLNVAIATAVVCAEFRRRGHAPTI